MSLVDAVKVLADSGVAALRLFGDDLSREDAGQLLPMWAQMRRLRELDDATADEVTHLVLARFAPDEPVAVPGVHFLPTFAPGELDGIRADAEPTSRRVRDRDGDVWQLTPDGCYQLVLNSDGSTYEGWWSKDLAALERDYGPLVEVPVVAAHKMAAGWGGVLGECGVECSCGTVFDNFDTIAEASRLLDQHIERGNAEVSAEPTPRRWRDSAGALWVEHAHKPGCVLYESRETHDPEHGVDLTYAIDHYGLVEAQPDAEAVA